MLIALSSDARIVEGAWIGVGREMDEERANDECSEALSGPSMMESSGGMKMVVAEPDPEPLERMLWMDGAGDGVRMGAAAARSIAFLPRE